MSFHQFVLVSALLVCAADTGSAQSTGNITIVPLTVGKGVPIEVVVTEKVPYRENALVHARIIQPVYVFDRQVIPPGAEVEGHITGFREAGKWNRLYAMLGGDFTPLREPIVVFDSLILLDGSRIPIETSVRSGTEAIVRPGLNREADADQKKSLRSTNNKLGSEMKSWLWAMSPYRPQYLKAGTPLTAEFLSPLDFGVAVLGKRALERIGSAPAADTTLSLRIVTPLNSRTVSVGSPVEAELTRPLFSPTRQLLFPVGAKVSGTIAEVTPARGFHRNGRLVFNFTKISPPESEIAEPSTPQEIHGLISSIEVQKGMTDMRIAQNGDAQIFESKARFVRPVWSFVKTDRALDATSRSFVSIPAARLSPLGIGLGLYGASRSIYASFIGRGRDIILPANTSVELRLEEIKKP